jgi:hypothetical protein
MAVESENNRPDSHRSQGHDFPSSPSNIVLLHDLEEIRAIWGKSVRQVYSAAARGELRAYGRPGRQKYYSDVELRAVFGEPKNGHNPPAHNSPRKRDGATGG